MGPGPAGGAGRRRESRVSRHRPRANRRRLRRRRAGCGRERWVSRRGGAQRGGEAGRSRIRPELVGPAPADSPPPNTTTTGNPPTEPPDTAGLTPAGNPPPAPPDTAGLTPAGNPTTRTTRHRRTHPSRQPTTRTTRHRRTHPRGTHHPNHQTPPDSPQQATHPRTTRHRRTHPSRRTPSATDRAVLALKRPALRAQARLYHELGIADSYQCRWPWRTGETTGRGFLIENTLARIADVTTAIRSGKVGFLLAASNCLKICGSLIATGSLDWTILFICWLYRSAISDRLSLRLWTLARAVGIRIFFHPIFFGDIPGKLLAFVEKLDKGISRFALLNGERSSFGGV